MAGSTPFLTVGPFGGKGGGPWDDGTHTGVRRVIIYHDDLIRSIQFEYDNNGNSILSSVHGKSIIQNKDEIKLDYPDEFLISISGYCTVEYEVKHLVVRSLTIKSNQKTYGPYGKEEGDYFSSSSTGCKIIGFHGWSGLSLDSIGTYLVPKDLISIGPFGGSGGNSFDDGHDHTTVHRMEIRYGDGFVSIQTVYYDKNGDEHWSTEHGLIGGGITKEVIFDYPSEYLIAISGYYTDSSDPVVQSLTLQSNKKSYGPYGTAEGKAFSTSSTGGKIIGFHGRSGQYINSIGAYFVPVSDA